jgi:ABC-2 type transport system permease protein
MSLRHIFILLGKEIKLGSKNFIFIFAIVIPIVISFIVSALFGELFLGKPKLGFADAGNSQMVTLAQAVDSFVVREYDTADSLKTAVASGAVDLGLVLPNNFDELVKSGQATTISAFIWGQSLLKNRAIAGFSIATFIREIAGSESPVEITTHTLGGETLPLQERLLPFIVLMTTMIGGIMVPATSIVEEKQKRTLRALTITPASDSEVFMAKGLIGVILSIVMGVLILVINQAFPEQVALLVLVLALGAVMAAAFGILLGILVKDINTLFATIKGIGILLYAPALVYLFPSIPEWIGRIFPTYYVIQPVVAITQQNGTWNDVALEVAVLIGLIVVLMAVVMMFARRARELEV